MQISELVKFGKDRMMECVILLLRVSVFIKGSDCNIECRMCTSHCCLLQPSVYRCILTALTAT
jgi:hypothetical protein